MGGAGHGKGRGGGVPMEGQHGYELGGDGKQQDWAGWNGMGGQVTGLGGSGTGQDGADSDETKRGGMKQSGEGRDRMGRYGLKQEAAYYQRVA